MIRVLCYSTDPACRIAVWDVFSVQEEIAIGHTADGDPFHVPASKSASGVTSHASQHRATLSGSGKDAMSECLSLCYLNSPVVVWTEDEGYCCPIQHVYLLFGLAVSRHCSQCASGFQHLNCEHRHALVSGWSHSVHGPCRARQEVLRISRKQRWRRGNASRRAQQVSSHRMRPARSAAHSGVVASASHSPTSSLHLHRHDWLRPSGEKTPPHTSTRLLFTFFDIRDVFTVELDPGDCALFRWCHVS